MRIESQHILLEKVLKICSRAKVSLITNMAYFEEHTEPLIIKNSLGFEEI